MRVPLSLREGATRYSLLPIRDDVAWRFYKKAQACTWTADEVDLSNDRFDSLSADEQTFVEHVLGFFAFGDGLVNENIVHNLLASVEKTELRFFYSFQLAIENVHAEMYAQLIDKYIADPLRKEQLNNAITQMAVMRDKATWMQRWICDPERTFAERLVAFACVEGIFFSGSFCAIYWLKNRCTKVKMPGLFSSNEFISRDEGLHCEFACYVHSLLLDPKDDAEELLRQHGVPHGEREATLRESRRAGAERLREIVESAVEVECDFVKRALPVSLIGMNSDLMITYIRFVADRLLVTLGAQKVFNASNPFPFMDLLSLRGKTNFFESRVSEYQKAGVMATSRDTGFTLNGDF